MNITLVAIVQIKVNFALESVGVKEIQNQKNLVYSVVKNLIHIKEKCCKTNRRH